MGVTGIGSGLSLNPTLQTYFEKMALDNLEANLFFHQLSKHEAIPANSGLTYNTYRYSKIPASTSTLTEGTVPTEVELSTTTSEILLAQYGQFVKISDLAITSHRTTTVPDAIKELSFTGAQSIDRVNRTALAAGATDYLVNSRAAISDITDTDVLDWADVREVVARFKNDNVRPLDNGGFAWVLHPYVMVDLRGDTASGSFLDLTKATSDTAYGKIMNGEVGRLFQSRFIETSEITSSTDGASSEPVYRNYAIGAGAMIDVDLANMPFNLFVKGLGTAGTADPLNQNASVGYKFTYGALYVGGDATSGRAREVLCASSLT